MPIYLVERDLPGLSRAQFDSAHRATLEAALRSTADGLAVHYLRGVFVPAEGRAVCLFEGPDADSVRAVNMAAGVPFSSVSEALELATELGRSRCTSPRGGSLCIRGTG